VEGGRHQVSVCAGTPAVLGWATGKSRRAAQQSADRHGEYARHYARVQKAKAVTLAANGLRYVSVNLPKQQRETASRRT